MTIEQIESLLAKLERGIQDAGERVVSSEKLGAMILEALSTMDKVAYVRFASVYKDFRDTEQFLRELNAIQAPIQ